jgi:hypothetical protein
MRFAFCATRTFWRSSARSHTNPQRKQGIARQPASGSFFGSAKKGTDPLSKTVGDCPDFSAAEKWDCPPLSDGLVRELKKGTDPSACADRPYAPWFGSPPLDGDWEQTSTGDPMSPERKCGSQSRSRGEG